MKKSIILSILCVLPLTACKLKTESFSESTQKTSSIPVNAYSSNNEGEVESVIAPTNRVNAKPVVNAGLDQSVNSGTTVLLAGQASDPDGSISSFSWVQTAGTPISLLNENTANASFVSPELSSTDTVVLNLTVTDNQGATTTDSINIMLLPVPMIDVGNDVVVSERQKISLKATVNSDGGAAISSYAWVQESGDPVTINNADQAIANVEIPLLSTSASYVFKAIITNSNGSQAEDTVTVTANTVDFLLNDTGITLCGDYAYGGSGTHNNDVDCALTVETGNGGDPVPVKQDGHYGYDLTHNDNTDGQLSFNFTKLDASGADLPASASNWSCVRDNVTGLIWEVKTDANKTDQLLWSDAESHAANLDLCGAGAGSWRLPTVIELQSIIHFGLTTIPAVDLNYFKNTQGNYYWASQPFSQFVNYYWAVNFNYGSTNYRRYDFSSYVRAVR